MRTALGLVALYAVAACTKGKGLDLQIHTLDSQIDRVELFIGTTVCAAGQTSGCTIAPKDFGQFLPSSGSDTTWYRDGDAVDTTSISDGVASFSLEAGDDVATIEVVAVGFKGLVASAVAVVPDVAVDATKQVVVDIDLAPADPLTATEENMQSHPDGVYLDVWTNTLCTDNGGTVCEAPSDCVAVEVWSNSAATRTLVVPSNDPDCDGFPTRDPITMQRNPLECAPTWWNHTSGAGPASTSSCATGAHVAGQSTCVLGGTGCIDGTGPGSSCAPVTDGVYCVPQVACDPSCTARQSACLDASGLGVTCTIYATSLGAPCAITQPGRVAMGALAFPGLFGGSARTCTGVKFADLSLSNVIPRSTVTVGQGNSAPGAVIGTTASADNTVTDCQVTLQWAGSLGGTTWSGGLVDGNAVASMTSYPFLAAIALDNSGSGSNLTMLVPVTFTLASCTGTMTDGIVCSGSPAVTDTITNCTM